MRKFINTEFSEQELRELIASTVKEVLQETFPKYLLLSNNSPPAISNDKLLSRKEVCQLLKVSLPTVVKLHNEGKIKFSIIRGSYRYNKKDIDQFLNQSGRG